MTRSVLFSLAIASGLLIGSSPASFLNTASHSGSQILSASPTAVAVFAPLIHPAEHSALTSTSSNPQEASIQTPVPPPSPTSPTTFKNGVVIPITGTASGAGFQSFQVEWASGLDAASGWQTIGVTLVGGGASPVTNSSLATWDTSSITTPGYYTIQLTVTVSGAPVQALTMIYLEPDLLSNNWPQYLPSGPAIGASVIPARNADGTYRLVMEAPAGPGGDTGEFWTLPLNAPAQGTTQNGHGSFFNPVVAGFSGGPGDEAMVIDFATGTPPTSSLELFNEDGISTVLNSNPNLWYLGSQLVAEDLLGDSNWETLGYGIDYTNLDASVSAWRPQGAQLNGSFPVQVPFQNSTDGRLDRNPVLIGDLNGDGKKEIVAVEYPSASTASLALFASDGTPLTWQAPAFPGTPAVMAAANLDNDGKLETILAVNTDNQTSLHVFQSDGTERPGWPLTLYNSGLASQSYLAVADLNLDGHKEIVYSHESLLYVFNSDGSDFSSAWPLQATSAGESLGYNAVTIGDVDGDGFPEIVTVLATLATNSDPFFAPGSYIDQQLLAIRRDGTISKSWQLNAGNGCWLQFFPAPAIGDFNQDGITDIAVTLSVSEGACGSSTSGVVTLLSTGAPFNPGLNDWPLVRRDPRNTSVLACSDFCLAASPAQTVDAGSPADYTITVTPNDTPYNFPIGNFSCSGPLPTGASCAFSPSSVTTGSSTGSTKLEISTTSRTLAGRSPDSAPPRFFFAAWLAAIVLAAILTLLQKRRPGRVAASLGFLLVLFAFAVSCGGGSAPNPNGTPAGTYTISVSATGESGRAQSTALTLTVN
jgi:hypothetical protein